MRHITRLSSTPPQISVLCAGVAVLGDEPNDTSIDDLTADTRREWLLLEQEIIANGLEPRILSTLRTCSKQNSLYQIGRGTNDDRKVVTHARGCRSWHVLGRAIDVLLYRDGKKVNDEASYELMGSLAKARGWSWGGDFKGFRDLVHVEWHPGRTTEEACPDVERCEEIQAAALAEPDVEEASLSFGGSTQTVIVVGVIAASAAAGAWWFLRKR